MWGFLMYNLKVGGCLAVFYLFYKLLLSRETFHRFNRIVLLSIMALSFVLPLCVITVYREAPAAQTAAHGLQSGSSQSYEVPLDQLPPELLAALHEVGPLEQTTEAASPLPAREPGFWLVSIFLAGAAGALAFTAITILRILGVIRSGEREVIDRNAILVKKEEDITPFSWLRYIVISIGDIAEHGREIIAHERAHLRLRHSYDLLIADLCSCMQWFNPAMWLLKQELKNIHEYEADREVLACGIDPKNYQLLLIKKAVGTRRYSIANSLNHSKLKNRITMMLQKKSPFAARAKALFVLPLACFGLTAFATTEYTDAESKDTQKSETIISAGQKDGDIGAGYQRQDEFIGGNDHSRIVLGTNTADAVPQGIVISPFESTAVPSVSISTERAAPEYTYEAGRPSENARDMSGQELRVLDSLRYQMYIHTEPGLGASSKVYSFQTPDRTSFSGSAIITEDDMNALKHRFELTSDSLAKTLTGSTVYLSGPALDSMKSAWRELKPALDSAFIDWIFEVDDNGASIHTVNFNLSDEEIIKATEEWKAFGDPAKLNLNTGGEGVIHLNATVVTADSLRIYLQERNEKIKKSTEVDSGQASHGKIVLNMSQRTISVDSGEGGLRKFVIFETVDSEPDTPEGKAELEAYKSEWIREDDSEIVSGPFTSSTITIQKAPGIVRDIKIAIDHKGRIEIEGSRVSKDRVAHSIATIAASEGVPVSSCGITVTASPEARYGDVESLRKELENAGAGRVTYATAE